MAGRTCRSSGLRRLGLQQPAPAPSPGRPSTAAAGAPPPLPPSQPIPPRAAGGGSHGHQPHHQPLAGRQGSGKQQALAAFQRLVEGASARSARFTALPPAPPALHPSTHHNNQPDAPPPPPAPAARQAGDPAVAGAAGVPPPQPPARPVVPQRLLPAADAALQALYRQLASRSATYLYQLDGPTAAAAALHNLCQHLTDAAATSTTGGLQQLLPDEAPRQLPQRLLRVATRTWEVIVLMLQHHHAAEPTNTAQQVAQLQASARCVWAAAGEPASSGHVPPALDGRAAGPEQACLLTDPMFEALSAMASAAAAWMAFKPPGVAHADWCYLQLRKHVCSLSEAADDAGLELAARQALQRLLLTALTGNLALAARQRQQAMWANLTRLVQQLLAATVLEREEALGACLVMAGALADQASCPAGDNAASSDQPHQARTLASCDAADAEEQGAAAAAAAEASVQLLEFAAELVSHARQQLGIAQAGAEEAATEQQRHGDTALAAQVGNIQEQVLMQLARAYLACAQPGRVLDCVAVLHGLATGRRPPPGIQQLASLALLQQGQLSTATTQLCLWLQQGGQSTEEACAAVRAFLSALHEAAASSSGMPQAAAGGSGAMTVTHSSAAEAVQRVVEAAAERCRSDPAVALVVVQQLLSDQGGGCATLDRLAVQLLAIEEVSQLLRQRPGDCQCVHALLHLKGAAHYAAHRQSAAIELLTPAVFFSASLAASKSARLLAMAWLKAGQPARVLQYVQLAEQQQGMQATAVGCLIRLRATLQLATPAAAATAAAAGAQDPEGNAAAAAASKEAVVAAVQQLAGVAGFDEQAAQAAFGMCMQHGYTAAAWRVLLGWRDVEQPASADANGPSSASCSSRRLLQVLSLMVATADSGRQPPPPAWLEDMCATFCSCVASPCGVRAAPAQAGDPKAPGADTRSPASSSVQIDAAQLQWLVDCGLRLVTVSVSVGLQEQALAVARDVVAACSALGNLTAAAASAPLRARSMAAAAAAAALVLQQKQPAADQRALKQASELLEAAQQQCSAGSGAPLSNDEAPDVVHQHSLLLARLNLALACRRGREHAARQALQQLAAHPGVTPHDLHVAARECQLAAWSTTTGAPASGRPQEDARTATLAFSHMLRLAAAAAPPDGAAVADAAAGIMLAPGVSHAVKLRAASKVVSVLAALRQHHSSREDATEEPQAGGGRVAASGFFPEQSLQWMLATCWRAAVDAGSKGGEEHASVASSGYLAVVRDLARHQLSVQAAAGPGQEQQEQEHWLLGSRQYGELASRLKSLAMITQQQQQQGQRQEEEEQQHEAPASPAGLQDDEQAGQESYHGGSGQQAPLQGGAATAATAGPDDSQGTAGQPDVAAASGSGEQVAQPQAPASPVPHRAAAEDVADEPDADAANTQPEASQAWAGLPPDTQVVALPPASLSSPASQPQAASPSCASIASGDRGSDGDGSAGGLRLVLSGSSASQQA